MFKSTKHFTHEQGLSCCFRQWKADSHCSFLHGYAIGVKITFANPHLDERHWVMDFGGLGAVKEFLKNVFDHKLLVAKDDPLLEYFTEMAEKHSAAQVVIVDAVGCEAFAFLIYAKVADMLRGGTTKVESVEVMEHAGNSAIYMPAIQSFDANPVDPAPAPVEPQQVKPQRKPRKRAATK